MTTAIETKFWIEPSVTLNEEKLLNILNKVFEFHPSLKDSFNNLKKIYFIETGKVFYKEINKVFREHNMDEHDIDGFHMMYDFHSDNAGFRGLNLQDKGVIFINLFKIKDCSDYYVDARNSGDHSKWNFSLRESRYADLDNYTTSLDLCNNFLFWNTLIHEIRHTEQYENPDLNLDMYRDFIEYNEWSRDETDAVGFAKCVFRKFVQKEDYQVL